MKSALILLLVLSAPAFADNHTDHVCAQDLLVQFDALKREKIESKEYKPEYVNKFRVDFLSEMKPSDRVMGTSSYGYNIVVSYGVCDASRSGRYRMLRYVFEYRLKDMK